MKKNDILEKFLKTFPALFYALIVGDVFLLYPIISLVSKIHSLEYQIFILGSYILTAWLCLIAVSATRGIVATLYRIEEKISMPELSKAANDKKEKNKPLNENKQSAQTREACDKKNEDVTESK